MLVEVIIDWYANNCRALDGLRATVIAINIFQAVNNVIRLWVFIGGMVEE